jgi:hypothetical protein
MKKTLIALFVLILVSLSTTAFAQGRQDFTLVNKTGVIINTVHISPSSSDDWGEDILGRDALDKDQDCDIKFHPRENVCKWDLKVTDTSGNSLEWTDLDLCKAVKITLHWDASKGVGTADIEE